MPPHKVVLLFLCGGLFKTMNDYTPRVKTFKNFPDQAVFPCRIHPLKTDQNTVFVVCIHGILDLGDLLPHLFELILGIRDHFFGFKMR